MRTYLSGGMEYANDEGTSWRSEIHQWVEKHLHHEVFNPNVESDAFLAAHHPGLDFRELKLRDIAGYSKVVEHLVQIDTQEIAKRSDYVICYWDDSAQRGAGTKGEITIAKFFNKPVYMVTIMSLIEIPGWVLACTTKIFPGFDELKTYLKEKYSD